MELPTRRVGAAIVVSPKGRIDHQHADSFKQALDPYLGECKAGGAPLVLDFSAVSYISSVGLRALMLAARQVKAQGGRIAIAALTPIVGEVFEISRFNLVYAVFAYVDAALTSLSGEA